MPGLEERRRRQLASPYGTRASRGRGPTWHLSGQPSSSRARGRRPVLLSWIPPWAVVLALLALIISQLFFVVLPGRRRYGAVLLLTVGGLLLGQAWHAVGLPDVHLGGAGVLPGAAFALVLQPLGGRLPGLAPDRPSRRARPRQ